MIINANTYLYRRESAHANAVENFPFFLGSVVSLPFVNPEWSRSISADIVNRYWLCTLACRTELSMVCLSPTRWYELDTPFHMFSLIAISYHTCAAFSGGPEMPSASPLLGCLERNLTNKDMMVWI